MQLAIDGTKKIFDIDVNDEIKRISAQKCMIKDKDYPKFMAYTAKIPTTKNGKDRSYEDIVKDRNKVSKRIDETIECPMNWAHDCLDKIQGCKYEHDVDTLKYLVEKPKGKVNDRQMNKIAKIIDDYDAFIRANIYTTEEFDDIEEIDKLKVKTDEVIETISEYRISQATMYRLIQCCLGYMGRVRSDRTEAFKILSKNAMRMMKVLYETNSSCFLSCFTPKILTEQGKSKDADFEII